MGTYIVKEDFLARTSDELTVRKGDVIIDGLPSGYGWVQGECRGKIGHVPASFLMELKKDRTKPPRYLRRQSLINGMRNDRLRKRNSIVTNHIPPYRSFYPVKVLYQYNPVHHDELALKPNDVIHVIRLAEEGWYEGMLNGKRGLFPSNYVTWNYDDQKDEQQQKQQQQNGRKKSARRKARVLYNYRRAAEDELTLNVGDTVTILDKDLDDEGWWKGEINGRVGIFPDNYVEEIPSSSTANVDSSTNFWTKSYLYKSTSTNDDEIAEQRLLPSITKRPKRSVPTPSSHVATNGTGETLDQLQNEISSIRTNLDGMKSNLIEQIGELARELDDERKARASLQIELERIQKVLQKYSQRAN